MTKRELVIEVAEKLNYTQNEVSDVIQAALDSITESLAQGDRLEVRNFGVFEVKTRDSRVGRNPRTGEEVPIASKRVASFKPGKALKQLVQEGRTAPVSSAEASRDAAANSVPEPLSGQGREGPGQRF